MVFKKMGNWMSKTSQGLIGSKIVLYILVVLVIVNLYNYSMIGDEIYAGVMLIIGFLTSFFSKNMIVILALAIGITYLLNYNNTKLFSEGAQNMKEAVDGDDAVNKPVLGDDADDKSAIDAADEPTADESTSANDIATAATAAASEVDNNTAETESKERAKLTSEIKKDFASFEKTAASITKSMQEIEPLLEKAEGFIQKYEKYSKM